MDPNMAPKLMAAERSDFSAQRDLPHIEPSPGADPRVRALIPTLIELMSSKGASPLLRIRALQELARFGQDAAVAVPSIAATLKEKTEPVRVRTACCRALSSIGVPDDPTRRLLLSIRSDDTDSAPVRAAVADLLVQLKDR